MPLERYSLGIGDRFGREGKAQLRALDAARGRGVRITPVWNKSNREHTIIGTTPEDTRRSADAAVRAAGWTDAFYVDADHIGLATVDRFVGACDFFTIDVADLIGQAPPAEAVSSFLRAMSGLKGTLRLPGLEDPIEVTDALLAGVAARYLSAVAEAGRVHARIAEKKGSGASVIEVSLDEAGTPQTPAELLFILAAIARQGIPVRTIAPKFSGAFLKGVDYVGDVGTFAREFDADLAVLEFARKTFDLPADLKLSVHSGSDKFSLYPVMRRAMLRRGAGLHLKTAGTTWLEEVIGLASAGGEGLRLAKDIYAQARARFGELARPYLPVISIDESRLPPAAEVASWDSRQFVEALRHDPGCPGFDPRFRQLVHIAFRIAAEMGGRFTDLLETYRTTIETHVAANLYDRHIVPLFLQDPGNGRR
ncbi:MAG TPA: tagaturonate epimerase family protein [Acidobacteriota bacterium]|nr:tagaturonate epimerase family protein [Acidobacteriota bacterium]